MVLIAAGPIFSQPTTDFYVSPRGSDANPGTKNRPFRTIARAQQAVRATNQNMQRDITVYLSGGEYPLEQTVVFDARDSGTNGHLVIYRAVEGESPMISGGKKINGWSQSADGRFRAPAAGMVFRQLYVNGKRAIRARTPNTGDYYRLVLWDKAEQLIFIRLNEIMPWRNFQQVEMVLQMSWAIGMLRLDSFTTTGEDEPVWFDSRYAKVKVQQPERSLVFKRFFPGKHPNTSYHFENAIEFLDAPGEWYLDNHENIVYYVPRPTETAVSCQAIAPALETLFRIEGTLDQPVHHLRFQGLTFAHSTWLHPGNNGYLGLQAGLFSLESTDKNIQFVDRPPAAVLVKAGHHIQFIGNQFQHLGATALDLCHAVSDNLVEGNTFEDIAGIGIALARFNDGQAEIHSIYQPDDAREICRRNIIRNNFIQFAGQDYADACGIAIGYARETLVEHNEIADLPYTGISMGWGWYRDENVMRDNTIQYNEIHHVVKLLADGGGIYTLSRQPNSLIKANYIHDIRQSPWVVGHESGGIFMDEGSGGIALENNVFVNVEKKIKLHKVHGISILGYDLSGSELETVKATAGLEPKFQNLRGK
jgi:hypothetical protein